MQENNHNFLPFLFNEPIYLVKKEFVDRKSNAHTLSNAAPLYREGGKDQDGVITNNTLVKESAQVKEPAQKLDVDSDKIKAAPVLKYAGKNLKKVLILFNNPQGEMLSMTQEVFLGKILHAVKLNFDDVALVNTADLEDALIEQINHFNALIHISFGVKSPNIIFKPDSVAYKIFKESGKVFLLADDLDTIEKEKEKKVLLWDNLKTLFVSS